MTYPSTSKLPGGMDRDYGSLVGPAPWSIPNMLSCLLGWIMMWEQFTRRTWNKLSPLLKQSKGSARPAKPCLSSSKVWRLMGRQPTIGFILIPASDNSNVEIEQTYAVFVSLAVSLSVHPPSRSVSVRASATPPEASAQPPRLKPTQNLKYKMPAWRLVGFRLFQESRIPGRFAVKSSWTRKTQEYQCWRLLAGSTWFASLCLSVPHVCPKFVVSRDLRYVRWPFEEPPCKPGSHLHSPEDCCIHFPCHWGVLRTLTV